MVALPPALVVLLCSLNGTSCLLLYVTEMLQNRGSSTARVDYSRRVMAQGGATGEMRAQPPPAPGTPPYDAKAVDAWAMGVMLYLLVTGRYPFEVRLT